MCLFCSLLFFFLRSLSLSLWCVCVLLPSFSSPVLALVSLSLSLSLLLGARLPSLFRYWKCVVIWCGWKRRCAPSATSREMCATTLSLSLSLPLSVSVSVSLRVLSHHSLTEPLAVFLLSLSLSLSFSLSLFLPPMPHSLPEELTGSLRTRGGVADRYLAPKYDSLLSLSLSSCV